MAYYNRRFQLLNTLKSITLSSFKDIEVVVVDDGSDVEHDIRDLQSIYSFLKVIRIEPKEKTWINPCIPFNIGFDNSNGEIILIQNPENIHATDILSYTYNFLKENDYFLYGCYSITEELTRTIDNKSFNDYNYIVNHISPIQNEIAFLEHDNKWYQHSIINNRKLNFCSATYNKNIKKLGGFNPKYSHGICFDDDDFRDKMCNSLNSKSIDDQYVIHQWHEKKPVSQELFNKNKILYYNK